MGGPRGFIVIERHQGKEGFGPGEGIRGGVGGRHGRGLSQKAGGSKVLSPQAGGGRGRDQNKSPWFFSFGN